MNSVLTEYPVETLYDAEVDEIDPLLTAEEVNSEIAGEPNSILEQFVSIEYFSKHVSITWRDFRINVPYK